MFQGNQGLISGSESNYGAFLPRKVNEGKQPHPSQIISGSNHIYLIDSKERNKNLFPNPASYSILFNESFKNVTSVELKGSVLPKTEYNVNTQNNIISFNVQDFITSIKIKNKGFGYENGTYGFGQAPPNDTLVAISEPGISGGTQAEVTVVVTNNEISSITLADPGSGYLRGIYGNGFNNSPDDGFYSRSNASFINRIPFDTSIKNQIRADVDVIVGNEIPAFLNIGQYDFAHPNDSQAGLCREVTRALQEATQNAIDDGIIVPVVGGPQTGAQYFPYSVADSNDGSCFLFTPNANASENTNVAVQRGSDDGTFEQSLFLELLWGDSTYNDSSASSLLGFGSRFIKTLGNTPLNRTSGVTGDLVPIGTWTSTPIESEHNYDLTGFPKYCVLCFGESANDTVDRVESTNKVLDKAFATLIFDANGPDVIFREPASPSPVEGEGNSNFSTLLQKPGFLKGIKGADFDPKVLNFGPSPLSELRGISIQLRKYNGDLYDFKGRDHLLIFQIGANDVNSGNRW